MHLYNNILITNACIIIVSVSIHVSCKSEFSIVIMHTLYQHSVNINAVIVGTLAMKILSTPLDSHTKHFKIIRYPTLPLVHKKSKVLLCYGDMNA